MSIETWQAVDEYLTPRLALEDEALRAAVATSREADLPEIAVSANQGKMLQVLARSIGARKILEVGTLGGYSTIWLARALPAGGSLISLEAEPKHAEVATANLQRAGLSAQVEIRLGQAIDSFATLLSEGAGPFDFVFIDADKPSIPAYFDAALRLARPGTMIIVDNVVRRGGIVDLESEDIDVQGCQQLIERLANEPRVAATVVQTVGAKGHDGFVLATVL